MFLIDSSALWRLWRDEDLQERWRPTIEAGEVRTCIPQRIELCRSARTVAELEEMSRDLGTFYPDVAVPKGVWRWIDSAQHALVRAGAVRAFSLVDLLICGVAAHHGLEILHDDHDFAVAARHLTDVRQRRI
ncbi:MAG TPA: PIN domain-containing protein [Microlunatus sp.]